MTLLKYPPYTLEMLTRDSYLVEIDRYKFLFNNRLESSYTYLLLICDYIVR